MKAILEFNLPEEREEHTEALNGWKYKLQLDEVWDKVFRPAYKHGYLDDEINKLLEDEKCDKLFDKLADLYREVIKDNQ